MIMTTSKLRGHDIYYNEQEHEWEYCDNGDRVSETHQDRRCGYCGKESTQEGHDGCIGKLIGLMNACCGHGNPSEAYVQFLDGECIHGEDAVAIQNILKKHRKE